MQNLIKCYRFIHKILRRNKILTKINAHNCVVYLQKLTRNNPNLHLLNVNAYAKFDLIPSIHFQVIERKQSRNGGMTDME